MSRKLHDRNEKLSAAVRDIAWKAQLRLCSRYRRLAAVGKPKVVVTTAIARKMVGSYLGHRRHHSTIARRLTKPPAGNWESRPTPANPTVRTAGDRTTVGNPPALL